MNIPHEGEIVSGVTNYNGMPAIDLSRFEKPRDARLSEEEAARRQYARAMRSLGRGASGVVFIGNLTEPVVGTVEMSPTELAEFNDRLAELISDSIARLRERIAADDYPLAS